MNQPLVSVIIPTYNHGRYLNKTINSVLNQSYTNLEIIVIDDGSTDHTKEVVSAFDMVKYIYQKNAGVSAARNNAIPHCKGEYLLFLDGDDWLFPNAIDIQISYFNQTPNLSFVSGGHVRKLIDENRFFQTSIFDLRQDNFKSLLKSNYIAHPAAVLFRREVFYEYKFEIKYKACQDYDLYLSVARKNKVLHHKQLVSAYRLHSTNLSSDFAFMLKESLDVLLKHKKFLKSNEEIQAWEQGKKLLIDYYTTSLYREKLRKLKVSATLEEKQILKKYAPQLYLKYIGNKLFNR